jgi:hypothetical protein
MDHTRNAHMARLEETQSCHDSGKFGVRSGEIHRRILFNRLRGFQAKSHAQSLTSVYDRAELPQIPQSLDFVIAELPENRRSVQP